MIDNRILVDLEGGGPEIGLMKSWRQFIETDSLQLDIATYEVLSELREQGLRLIVRDSGVDDDIITFVPINGRRHAVFVSGLQGVDNANDLVLRRDKS